MININCSHDCDELQVGAPILKECLRGYNGTILAYGQFPGGTRLGKQVLGKPLA